MPSNSISYYSNFKNVLSIQIFHDLTVNNNDVAIQKIILENNVSIDELFIIKLYIIFKKYISREHRKKVSLWRINGSFWYIFFVYIFTRGRLWIWILNAFPLFVDAFFCLKRFFVLIERQYSSNWTKMVSNYLKKRTWSYFS